MVARIEIEGSARLVSTLASAARDLRDFATPARAAAATAAAAARGLAPVRTGELRGSIRSRGAGRTGVLQATAPHARPVHWGVRGQPGIPFLSLGAQTSEAIWVRGYEEHVRRTLNTVKGK